MNYETCPVYDCCGGTIIRDNGMRARCRTCDGRGVVEAPRVPPVTSTREPMVVTVARGTDVHDYAPAKGSAMPDYVHGIREGERRMLWAIAVGACWQSHFSLLGYTPGRRDQAYAVATYAMRALEDLGDEDASRVLGERGW